MPTLVAIVPYDPTWPTRFRECAVELQTLLGRPVVGIEHIGSTAVPGLPAKPLLDIDVTLRGADYIAKACDALVGAGYVPRGNRYDDGLWAFLLRASSPPRRVYVCAAGNGEHTRRIAFRDYLRNHDEAAQAYALLKMRLAAEYPYDGDRYTAAKRSFIDEIMHRARSPIGE